jgi:8-amino-7-oxononanoate synthase
MKKEAAVIFGTGFQANYAALSALTEKGDAMICDHNLHASLVEGALRSPARTARFRHNDLDHFERCLENCPPQEKVLVITEGVFSMEGDIANLRGIVKLAKLYGARVYVDEAHGIGVLGENGAGASEHLGVLEDVDIVMGTFSKSMASVGGFIAGERSVVDYLKHTAVALSSASLPAASVAQRWVLCTLSRTRRNGSSTCCISHGYFAANCVRVDSWFSMAKRRSSRW